MAESSTAAIEEVRICSAIRKDGRPCRAHCVAGSGFCFAHDPGLAEKRFAARSKGGRARHGRKLGTVAGAREPVVIDGLDAVCQVLENEINEVLHLERSVSRARALGYLCGILVNIYTPSELEQRIAALEERLG